MTRSELVRLPSGALAIRERAAPCGCCRVVAAGSPKAMESARKLLA